MRKGIFTALLAAASVRAEETTADLEEIMSYDGV